MSEADMSANFDHALQWFDWLYGDQPNGYIWVGGHANGFKGVLCSSARGAAETAIALDQAGQRNADAGSDAPWGVYHRLTTMREVAKGRGDVADSVALPALMMDLDLRGPGHVSDRYPETGEDLALLLADAGLPEPSAWIDSGGGRYAVWRLSESLDLSTDGFQRDALPVAQEASRALQRAVIDAGRARGWKVDNTSDLARIFRVPGTTNRKAGGARMARALGDSRSWATGFDLAGLRPRENTPSAPSAAGAPLPSLGAHDESAAGVWIGGLAGLFGQSAGAGSPGVAAAGVRGFTVTEAMAFVAPKLSALAAASDGEINVRLNEAACALAHFGPEFWDQDAADGQLEKALSATVYDGATWKAADTIASARRAMAGAQQWRAFLVPSAHEAFGEAATAVAPDVVDALLAEMVSIRELADRPAPRFVIQGLLQFDSESWIIGAPGSKKSFAAFDMAARVSRGEPWQGRRTNAADIVMIVAEGASGAGKRGKAWEKEYGPIDHMLVLPRPVQAADFVAWRVLIEACARLGQRAQERGRGLMVIIDTQARVTVGLDENSAKEMGIYVEAVRAIRERTGACVLSVHHTGRSGGDARGSSAIDGAQTTELKIESASGALTGRMLSEKQKDIEPAPPIQLMFKSVFLGLDGDGEAVTSLVIVPPDAWDDAVVDGDSIRAGGTGQSEDPFGERQNLDAWIVQRVPRATSQWWIVQALVDTAETLGLTRADVRRIVVAKRGQGAGEVKNWEKAWQKVTDESGVWADVVRPAGGQRWTVDRVAMATLSENASSD